MTVMHLAQDHVLLPLTCCDHGAPVRLSAHEQRDRVTGQTLRNRREVRIILAQIHAHKHDLQFSLICATDKRLSQKSRWRRLH